MADEKVLWDRKVAALEKVEEAYEDLRIAKGLDVNDPKRDKAVTSTEDKVKRRQHAATRWWLTALL
jgi:biotin synthase-related radical SAM superfamily protein